MTFNARSEEAAEKPTWRQSLRSQRCLMPAWGWYEWNESELVRNEAGRKVKQPYFISLPDADFMAFAGLWAVWQGQDGSQVLSCALLSKTAAPSIAHIHDRMPVVLKPDHFAAWLDPKTQRQDCPGCPLCRPDGLSEPPSEYQGQQYPQRLSGVAGASGANLTARSISTF